PFVAYPAFQRVFGPAANEDVRQILLSGLFHREKSISRGGRSRSGANGDTATRRERAARGESWNRHRLVWCREFPSGAAAFVGPAWRRRLRRIGYTAPASRRPSEASG